MWYHYILLDFEGRHATPVNGGLFHTQPQIGEKDPDLYMRSLLLSTGLPLPAARKRGICPLPGVSSSSLKQTIRTSLNDNSLNDRFYLPQPLQAQLLPGEQRLQGGEQFIAKVKAQLPRYQEYTDVHRILLFYSGFAYLYFCLRKFERLEYLQPDHPPQVLLTCAMTCRSTPACSTHLPLI